ncbi:MAG: DUF6876 family protein [Methanomassiliicoccales archaeon]
MSATAAQLNEILAQSYGTERYHQHFGVAITDGVKAIIDKANSHWLVSDLGVNMNMIPALKTYGVGNIIFWTLTVKKDGSANMDAWTDAGGTMLHRQHYDITDFPVGVWKFYWQRGVLMVPNEY